jgi:hypothetical protein
MRARQRSSRSTSAICTETASISARCASTSPRTCVSSIKPVSQRRPLLESSSLREQGQPPWCEDRVQALRPARPVVPERMPQPG